MASRRRRVEVLQETFADRDSDLSKKSKLEFKWDASVSSGNNLEPEQENQSGNQSKSVDERDSL